MKGAFSSPETIVALASLRSLFPDTPYGFESGGHPRDIPKLTHRQLREYHGRFYHPSNCKIFLYGNIPTPRTLKFLEENFLKSSRHAESNSAIAVQPRWKQPRTLERTFPAAAGNARDLRGKSSVTLNWLAIPVTDPVKLLSFEVLSELLVGNEGAPLHKALLESRLGDDLSPATGLDTELGELVFTAGLRGTDPERAGDIEELVLATLSRLSDGGVPDESVQAALQRIEFRNREIVRGGRPYSLTLMRRTLRGWLHGSDPEITLEFQRWFDVLKGLVGGGRYFEDLIEGYLLANNHRSTVVVRPDPKQQSREAEEERTELRALRESLDAVGIRKIENDGKRLRSFQEQEESPEIVAGIPALHLEDLKSEVETISTETVLPDLGTPVLFHDLFTNGIVYLDLVFDTSKIAAHFFDLLPLFSWAVRGSGLPGIPYYDVARRLSLLTGGFGSALSADTSVASPNHIHQKLIFRVKMLEQNLEEAVSLVRDLLLRSDFRDLDRLQTIVLEIRNDMKASLVPGGSHYASLRAGSRLRPALAFEERWKGISQYLFVSQLCKDLDGNASRLASSLESTRAALLASSAPTLNLTCEQKAVEKIAPVLRELVSSISAASNNALSPAEPAETVGGNGGSRGAGSVETLIGSMNVSFVAHAIPASTFGSRENAHEAVLSHYLYTGFLWERVRMKGGAYGAGASSNGLESLFGFYSYRDPNTVATLDAFRQALSFAAGREIEDGAFEKVVLGAAGKEERPMAPGEKGFVALKRQLLGISDAQRQSRRDALIACTPQELRVAAERLLSGFDEGTTAILTHKDAAEKEGRRLLDLKPLSLHLPD